MRTYIRRRRKRNILKKWIIPGILIAAAIVAVCVLIFRPRPYQRFGSELSRLAIDASSQICPFSSGAAYISAGEQTLHCIGAKGESLWGFTNAADEMHMASSSQRLAVYISTKLQMLDNTGAKLFTANYEYPIQAMEVGDTVSALLQYTGESARQILVISNNGQTLDTLTEPVGQNILNFGVFGENGSGVWVITIDHSSITPSYKFFTYRYDGQKKITVSYTDEGQALYKPIFYSSSIALIGSTDVIGIDYTGKVLYRTRANGYEMDQKSTGTDILLKKSGTDGQRSNGRPELLCIAHDGASIRLFADQEILGAYSTEKYYYLFTANNMFRYSKRGMDKVTFTLPEIITEIIPADGYILLKGESYYRLEID